MNVKMIGVRLQFQRIQGKSQSILQQINSTPDSYATKSWKPFSIAYSSEGIRGKKGCVCRLRMRNIKIEDDELKNK